jgi:DNA-binding MarR family transcriptional regulator
MLLRDNSLMNTDQGHEAAAAELVEQVVRLVYASSFRAGLNPAQWSALRYFNQANRQVRTASAFARFHATTKGTATQTITALERKGFLERVPMPGDRRSRLLEVTPAGAALLQQDPINTLVNAINQLSTEQQQSLTGCLESIVRHFFRRS